MNFFRAEMAAWAIAALLLLSAERATAAPSFSPVPSFIINSQATRVIGETLENTDGEKLGKIKDLVIALPSGEVRYVLVTTGGILGVASHTKIVPAAAVSLATAKKHTAFLDINLRRWKDAPQFKRKTLADFGDPKTYEQIERYYAGNATTPLKQIKPTGGNIGSAGRTIGGGSTLRLASDLIGKRIVGAGQETIGVLSDLLIDLDGKKPTFAIIWAYRQSRKDYTFAVAFGSVASNGSQLTLRLNPASLERAPAFSPRAWTAPEPNAIYRYVLLGATNTAWNARDREGHMVTPQNQSESERDLDITSRLRQQLVSYDNLTFTAKNVKIITIDGRVTLRGPVKRPIEKQIIQRKAELIAGNGSVENLLEVEENR